MMKIDDLADDMGDSVLMLCYRLILMLFRYVVYYTECIHLFAYNN